MTVDVQPITVGSVDVTTSVSGGVGAGDGSGTGGVVEWGNITGVLSDQTDLQAALDAIIVDAVSQFDLADTVNPMESRFGAVGDGVTDDTAAVQAALDYLAANNGGKLLLTRQHYVSAALTYTNDNALCVEGHNPYKAGFTTDQDIFVLDVTISVWGRTAPVFRGFQVMKTGSTVGGGTAIRVRSTTLTSGSSKGAVFEGLHITRSGSCSFGYGIDLDQCPHTVIANNFIQGTSGTTTTKYGAGVALRTFCNGTTITNNKLRGWLAGVEAIDDFEDITIFEGEGFNVTNNTVTNNDYGIRADIQQTEISWRIGFNSFDCATAGVQTTNLRRFVIIGNAFGWNGKHKDHRDIYLKSTNALGALNTGQHQCIIEDNYTFRNGNITDGTVTGVTRGATTVISYSLGASVGTLANDTIIYLDNIVGTTELNGKPYKVANLDTGALTLELRDRWTGAAIDSSAYTAYVSGGNLERYGAFIEIESGSYVSAQQNQIATRSLLANIGENTRYIDLIENKVISSGAITTREVLSISDYPETISHRPRGGYDDGGAPGDGSTSDTASLQRVWDAGRSIRLDPRKSYFLTKALVHPGTAGIGIECNGASLVMSTASGHFDNTVSGSAGGTNARAIIIAGASNAARISKPFVRNLKVATSAWVDDRWVGALRLQYVTDFEISGCEFSGFSRGANVTLNNVDGGRVVGNTFRDSYSNSTTASGQVTGLESDGNAAVITDDDGTTYSSKDVLIEGNTFSNLTMSYAAIVALGNQTDGINLAGPNSVSNPKPTRNFRIIGNHFYNVGEAIDCFGCDNIIKGNTFRRSMNFGVKLIYGASRNIVSENSFTDSGLAAVALEGQTSTYSDADANMILNNSIKGVAPAGDWQNADGNLMWDATAAAAAWGASTANTGIRLNFADTSPASVITNTVIDGNVIDCDGTGKYGIWVDNTASSTATNVARNNRVSGFTTTAIQDAGSFLQIGRPLTVTANTTLTVNDVRVINNKAGSTCTLTLPAAADNPGHEIQITNWQAQTVVSASSNVVPLAGGAAGAAILAGSAGAWAVLVSDGTNYNIVRGS
jgi:hypothetical protein